MYYGRASVCLSVPLTVAAAAASRWLVGLLLSAGVYSMAMQRQMQKRHVESQRIRQHRLVSLLTFT